MESAAKIIVNERSKTPTSVVQTSSSKEAKVTGQCWLQLLNNDQYVPRIGVLVCNRVFVKGIPDEATIGDINSAFEQFGTVKEIKIITDRHGKSKGYGFVTFENKNEALKVMKNDTPVNIIGANVVVGPAVKKPSRKGSTLTKRRNQVDVTSFCPRSNAANNTVSKSYRTPFPHEQQQSPINTVSSYTSPVYLFTSPFPNLHLANQPYLFTNNGYHTAATDNPMTIRLTAPTPPINTMAPDYQSVAMVTRENSFASTSSEETASSMDALHAACYLPSTTADVHLINAKLYQQGLTNAVYQHQFQQQTMPGYYAANAGASGFAYSSPALYRLAGGGVHYGSKQQQ